MFYDDNCIGNLKHQFERFGITGSKDRAVECGNLLP